MRTILVLAAITSALGTRQRDTPLVRGSDTPARLVADAAVIIRTFQFAPDTLRAKPGTYRYFCDRHRVMTGIVIINPRGDID